MTTTPKLIRKAELKTNCPECYTNDGLQLEFYQPYVNGRWYKRFLTELSSKIHCTKCETEIFPVSWTPDIERVYDYHRKSTPLHPSERHWKPAGVIFILVGIMVITTAAIVGFHYLS